MEHAGHSCRHFPDWHAHRYVVYTMMREGDYDGAREVCANVEGALLSYALPRTVRGCRNGRRVEGQPCPQPGRTRPRFATACECAPTCGFCRHLHLSTTPCSTFGSGDCGCTTASVSYTRQSCAPIYPTSVAAHRHDVHGAWQLFSRAMVHNQVRIFLPQNAKATDASLAHRSTGSCAAS